MPDFHQGTLVVTQPPHFPTMHTRETVQSLAAFGLDENQVSVILRCTPDDVRRYYAIEMEHGLTLINSRVMSAVLHQALYKDDVGAMKLWLLNKAGWRTGDGAKIAVLPPGSPGAEGEMTVVQRREVITKLLVRATQEKRSAEKTIEGRVVSDNPRRTGPRDEDAGRRTIDAARPTDHRGNGGAAAPTQGKSNGNGANGNGPKHMNGGNGHEPHHGNGANGSGNGRKT